MYECKQGYRSLKLWYRVVAVASPWVAPQQAAHCEVETFERAVLAECLEGILRACGCEPA